MRKIATKIARVNVALEWRCLQNEDGVELRIIVRHNQPTGFARLVLRKT